MIDITPFCSKYLAIKHAKGLADSTGKSYCLIGKMGRIYVVPKSTTRESDSILETIDPAEDNKDGHTGF